jgi:RNA polymerase sigma-70 factor (ECF subfamily)
MWGRPTVETVVQTMGLAPDDLETYRRELTGYCYRMLASGTDADDAVQQTLVRAWQAADGFEGRSSVRSWLYRIATNVCLDLLRSRQRRAQPMDMGPARPPVDASLEGRLVEGSWVTPVPDANLTGPSADPADVAASRDTIRLAFVAALQHLPPRQRAALILCEVLRWQASEAAELLDTSTAAINSALQRARATLAETSLDASSTSVDPGQQALLDRYVDAFERYDIDELVGLLRDDAIQTMPPFAMWIEGRDDIGQFMLGPGGECRGSKLLTTSANGGPAYAQYKPDPAGGYSPWALHVIELSDGRISAIHSFLDTAELFPAFGMPDHLPA